MNTDFSKKQLLYGNIQKIFFPYLLASIGGMLGTSLYVLGDTMIVGRALGSVALAALNISIPIMNVFTGIGLLFGIGGATALSIDRGAGRTDDIQSTFNIALYLSLFAGILLTLVRIFFLDEFVYLMGASEQTFDMARDYLGVLMLFSIPFLLNSTLSVFIRNDGNPRLVMISMLTGSILNVILDYIFIVPMGLGMWGGALATGLSPVIGLAINSLHFMQNKNSLHVGLKPMRLDIVKRMSKNGFASFLIEVSAGIVIFSFNRAILNIIGDIGVSAYSIIANLSLICMAIFSGVAQSIQPLVSVNYGASKKKRVTKTIQLGFRAAIILGIAFFLIGLLIPEKLMAIFTTERGFLADLTIRGIRLYFSAFLITGINMTFTSYMQSMEKRTASTILSFLRGFVFVILLLLSLPPLLGLDGVWLTMPLAELLTLLISLIFFPQSRRALQSVFRK